MARRGAVSSWPPRPGDPHPCSQQRPLHTQPPRVLMLGAWVWPVPGRGRGQLPGSSGCGGHLHCLGCTSPGVLGAGGGQRPARRAGGRTAPRPSTESVGWVQKGTRGQVGGHRPSPLPVQPLAPQESVPLHTAPQHISGPRSLPVEPGQGLGSRQRALLGKEKPILDGLPGQLEEKALDWLCSKPPRPRPGHAHRSHRAAPGRTSTGAEGVVKSSP